MSGRFLGRAKVESGDDGATSFLLPGHVPTGQHGLKHAFILVCDLVHEGWAVLATVMSRHVPD